MYIRDIDAQFDHYNTKTIQVDDSEELNAYTVVGNYLYHVGVDNFKQQDVSTFEYVAGNKTFTTTLHNMNSYNKNNGLIFILHHRAITCFSTIDHSFNTIFKADSDCWHLSYGSSEDGKIIYVLKNTDLHIIDGMTERIAFTSKSGLQKKYLSNKKYWHDIFDCHYGLHKTTMTNSGKLIHFSVFDDKRFLNIYDMKSGKTVTSDEIKHFGNIYYSEAGQKVINEYADTHYYHKFAIYDMKLNETGIICGQLYSSDFYSIDYDKYVLNVYNTDCGLVGSFVLEEVKKEWDSFVETRRRFLNFHERDCEVQKQGNLFIISNVNYRLIYSLADKTFGNYLGKLYVQSHIDLRSELRLSDDGKHLLEFGEDLIYSYDITHLNHLGQKTNMLASVPHFTKDPLFDRNLLPLIFDFLPRGD